MKFSLVHPSTSARAIVEVLNTGVPFDGPVARKALQSTGQYRNRFGEKVLFWASTALVLALIYSSLTTGDAWTANTSTLNKIVDVMGAVFGGLTLVGGTFGIAWIHIVGATKLPFAPVTDWLRPLKDTPQGCSQFLEMSDTLPLGHPHIFAVGRELAVADLVLLDEICRAQDEKLAAARQAARKVELEAAEKDACALLHSKVRPHGL